MKKIERKREKRKEITIRVCFEGNLMHKVRMASTTTTLNSSLISDMKLSICFINLSTEASFPVFDNHINLKKLSQLVIFILFYFILFYFIYYFNFLIFFLTLRRVVMARVEIERLGSVIRFSISRLHVETEDG
jgi:hypothetical protein